jgi:precorrin-2 dehydrogenase/sirohydrochlorin ferrochelatase
MSEPQYSAAPRYYPVFLDLRGKRCVVVGGGQVALRKVEGLAEAGAAVTVIAPQVAEMPAGVMVLQRAYQPGDIDGAMLVIAATDDEQVNALVAREAAERGIWVNVVDDPPHCTVVLPSVVRRGALCIAISTGGASPTLARRLRERLEQEFGPEYGMLVELLRALRESWEPRAKAHNLPGSVRKRAWEQVLDLPLLDWLRAGEVAEAEQAANKVLNAMLGNHG